MCGRFTLTVDPGQLQEAFPWVDFPEIIPHRYNIAPTQPVGVVPNDGENRMDFYNWGLIPFWAKDPKIGNRMINARSETLAEKPSFRGSFKYKRCLVLADGFAGASTEVQGGGGKAPSSGYTFDIWDFVFLPIDF